MSKVRAARSRHHQQYLETQQKSSHRLSLRWGQNCTPIWGAQNCVPIDMLPTLPERRCRRPPQGSLPAGWLAFAGRELNPLDRDERFQITCSFPFPGLTLTLHPPVPAARVAEGPAQDPLLRPVASLAARAGSARPAVASARPADDSEHGCLGGRARRRCNGAIVRDQHCRASSGLPELQGGPPRRGRTALSQAGEWPMTSVPHDQHRCQQRVRSSRHGQSLPIVDLQATHCLVIAHLGVTFATATSTRALLGPPQRSRLTHDQPIPTEAIT